MVLKPDTGPLIIFLNYGEFIMEYTFENMSGMNKLELERIKRMLQDEFSQKIQRRDAIKAEILFLQRKIKEF